MSSRVRQLKLKHMKSKKFANITAWTLAALACTGCTITKAKLTGTEGATFSGYYRMTSHTNVVNLDGPQGKLPTGWFEGSIGIFSFHRLQECEFLKTDTNTSLVLTLKTHGFKGAVAAPPGASGVRVVRDGKKYIAETL